MAVVSDFLWCDSYLQGFSADYDEISFEFSGGVLPGAMTLHCRGYLALEMRPFWDETVVESVRLDDHSDLAESVRQDLERSGVSRDPSGCLERNSAGFTTVIIRLIDGCEARVVASSIDVTQSH